MTTKYLKTAKSEQKRVEQYSKMIEDALAGLENIVYFVEQKNALLRIVK